LENPRLKKSPPPLYLLSLRSAEGEKIRRKKENLPHLNPPPPLRGGGGYRRGLRRRERI